MTFSYRCAFAIAVCLGVMGCGGNDAPQTPKTEKSVENRPVTEPSSGNTPAPGALDDSGAATNLEPNVAFAALPEPYKSADYNRGRRTFKLCQSCHTLKEGAGNLVGPNLYGIFGREIGSVEGFKYSNVVEDANFVWTPEELEKWLENPRSYLPGNRMAFSGVRKPSDRTAVIAYIMAETGYSSSE
ncbi:MAG: c-type cytochrome [Pseudomonadota bacterium]